MSLLFRCSDVFQEPEWDVSSAFVANAASHIKLKGCKNRAVQISRENKENEVKSSQVIYLTLIYTAPNVAPIP